MVQTANRDLSKSHTYGSLFFFHNYKNRNIFLGLICFLIYTPLKEWQRAKVIYIKFGIKIIKNVLIFLSSPYLYHTILI